jgi:hypothetical protein
LWCIVALTGSAFTQTPLEVTIYDIQHTDPVVNPTSPLLGQIVKVKGLVMNRPNELWIGARYGVYLLDPDSLDENGYPKAWNGFFAIQSDSLQAQTGFSFLEPGMIVNFTGRVDEFQGFTEVEVYGNGYFPNPPIPVEILSAGNPLPTPRPLTAADFNAQPQFEQWESMYARVTNATIVNNQVPGNWASYDDGSGIGLIGEYSLWFRNNLNAGTYTWPSPGSTLEITGFTREETSGFTLNPLDTTDLVLLADPPPAIANFTRSIGVPTSTQDVEVSADFTDNGSVASGTVHYSVDEGSFQQVAMVHTAGTNTYTGTIPAQANGAFVRYFVSATDDLGGTSTSPGDTSRASGTIFWYDVRDSGTLSITDVQNTHGYALDASGYRNIVVTLACSFRVMTDSLHFPGDAYIQEAADRWSGIWLNDIAGAGAIATLGDEITSVTGTVQESFNVTRIDLITDIQISAGTTTPFDPVVVQTGQINSGGVDAEAYESVLVRVENVTVTNPFPDAPSNFGEFVVNDGTGDLRVDDLAATFLGNLDTTFTLGATMDAIEAIHYFSFSHYKLLPRDDNDIKNLVGIGDEKEGIPAEFSLEQNFPNPFNPSTTIVFNIAEAGEYRLAIFNILGQKIRTLHNGQQTPGRHQITWDALDDFGKRVGSGIYFYRLTGEKVNLVKKMILLK